VVSVVRAKLERALTWALGIALLGSMLAVGYVAVNPPETTDPYTEFYVLGPEGNASGYPSNLTVGESGAFASIVSDGVE
jgi:uncharacterized membrane protein